jgi:hypothetical protein
VERKGEGPVYAVQPVKGGEVRVLHRNHLLPVGEKLKELDDDSEKPKPKRPKRQVSEVVEHEDESETESSEVSEDERKQRQEVKPKHRKRQSKKPDRLRYDRLGSPGVDRSKDRVLGCIVQLLEQQQVLVSMLSSVFGQFQRLQTPGPSSSDEDSSSVSRSSSHQG